MLSNSSRSLISIYTTYYSSSATTARALTRSTKPPAMPSSIPPLPIIDPHFHIWDSTTLTNPNLGELTLSTLPVYSFLNYEEDCGVGVAGSVHIEAVVGQAEGAPVVMDPVAETRFVLEQVGAEGVKNVNIVAFVKLSSMPEAQAVLEAHKHVAAERFVGVRMILNYSAEDPSLTWPQVERGDFLTGGVPSFKEGFALLAPRGLSFDLQVNWFQLEEAATFLQAFPETVVIVDHMGCLKLGAGDEEDAQRIAVWQQGMKALAALPNVYVKLSMLKYMRPNWQQKGSTGVEASEAAGGSGGGGGGADMEEVEKEKKASEGTAIATMTETITPSTVTTTTTTDANAVVKARVREVIEWFGPERCMFASNFPVDKCLLGGSAQPTTLEALALAQHALISDLPDEQQRQLFSETAKKVYKLK